MKKDKQYTPNKCGNSMKLYGIYICKLKCAPCCEPCDLKRRDEFFDEISKTMWEIADNEQNEGDNNG